LPGKNEQLLQSYPGLEWSAHAQLNSASGPVNVSIVAVLRVESAAAVEETWMSTMVIADELCHDDLDLTLS
jgi:hypothetical protein